MKFKKILSVLAVGALAATLFTGCGGSNNQSEKDIRIGMISTLNASEQKVDEILKTVSKKSNVKVINHTTTFYKDLSTLQMGLESGSVDEISTYNCVANYLMNKNSKFEIVPDHGMKLSDEFCFAMLKTNDSLMKEINKALADIKKDGTLDKLIKEYITDAKADDPPAVEMPKFYGADTIKVAVTGDLPPLDLITANGKPAGFNTALLAEIGKRLNKNIEIIDIEGDARAAALGSGKADVIFWAILPVDESRPKDIDTPEGAVLSDPYFKDEITHLKLNQ